MGTRMGGLGDELIVVPDPWVVRGDDQSALDGLLGSVPDEFEIEVDTWAGPNPLARAVPGASLIITMGDETFALLVIRTVQLDRDGGRWKAVCQRSGVHLVEGRDGG